MKKAGLLILPVMIVLVVIGSGCLSQPRPTEGDIVLTDGITLSPADCSVRGLQDKVLVIHSPNCPACRQALPLLEELQNETGVEFEYIDITTDAGLKRVDQLNITSEYIPDVIAKCKVSVGYKSKEEFRDMILS